VSVLGLLEKYCLEWEATDQAFIVKTLNKQYDKLAGVFHRFVEEQVRSIEDMKVTAKKRQGVLLMFRALPVSHISFKLIIRDSPTELKDNLIPKSSTPNSMFERQ
jgi:Exocyst complex component Sec3